MTTEGEERKHERSFRCVCCREVFPACGMGLVSVEGIEKFTGISVHAYKRLYMACPGCVAKLLFKSLTAKEWDEPTLSRNDIKEGFFASPARRIRGKLFVLRGSTWEERIGWSGLTKTLGPDRDVLRALRS